MRLVRCDWSSSLINLKRKSCHLSNTTPSNGPFGQFFWLFYKWHRMCCLFLGTLCCTAIQRERTFWRVSGQRTSVNRKILFSKNSHVLENTVVDPKHRLCKRSLCRSARSDWCVMNLIHWLIVRLSTCVLWLTHSADIIPHLTIWPAALPAQTAQRKRSKEKRRRHQALGDVKNETWEDAAIAEEHKSVQMHLRKWRENMKPVTDEWKRFSLVQPSFGFVKSVGTRNSFMRQKDQPQLVLMIFSRSCIDSCTKNILCAFDMQNIFWQQFWNVSSLTFFIRKAAACNHWPLALKSISFIRGQKLTSILSTVLTGQKSPPQTETLTTGGVV